jgi:hypothetical protein
MIARPSDKRPLQDGFYLFHILHIQANLGGILLATPPTDPTKGKLSGCTVLFARQSFDLLDEPRVLREILWLEPGVSGGGHLNPFRRRF